MTDKTFSCQFGGKMALGQIASEPAEVMTPLPDKATP